jgi:hypothetical protein
LDCLDWLDLLNQGYFNDLLAQEKKNTYLALALALLKPVLGLDDWLSIGAVFI